MHAISAELGRHRLDRVLREQLSQSTILALDTKGAETIGPGTRIFPEPADPRANWVVLARRELIGGPAPLYAFAGVIDGSATPTAFVEEAYRHVLGRGVDQEGRAAYVPRIASGVLSRRSLLRSLANSGEARDRGRSLLVLPETTLWPAGLTDPDAPATAALPVL